MGLFVGGGLRMFDFFLILEALERANMHCMDRSKKLCFLEFATLERDNLYLRKSFDP